MIARSLHKRHCSDACRQAGNRLSWVAYGMRNREARRLAGRRRYDTQVARFRERVVAYRQTAKGAAIAKAHRETDRVKANARAAVYGAIKRGALVRQPCRVCGAKAQAHHDDYSKPLEVDWLCPRHHGAEHRKPRT